MPEIRNPEIGCGREHSGIVGNGRTHDVACPLAATRWVASRLRRCGGCKVPRTEDCKRPGKEGAHEKGGVEGDISRNHARYANRQGRSSGRIKNRGPWQRVPSIVPSTPLLAARWETYFLWPTGNFVRLQLARRIHCATRHFSWTALRLSRQSGPSRFTRRTPFSAPGGLDTWTRRTRAMCGMKGRNRRESAP